MGNHTDEYTLVPVHVASRIAATLFRLYLIVPPRFPFCPAPRNASTPRAPESKEPPLNHSSPRSAQPRRSITVTHPLLIPPPPVLHTLLVRTSEPRFQSGREGRGGSPSSGLQIPFLLCAPRSETQPVNNSSREGSAEST